MPFLRIVRDKRGYETTYLIHSKREGSHQGSRVLYAFRSPGGVRVGRPPFEPAVRREIEAGNPAVVFNWDELLSGQQVIDSTPEQRRPRRKATTAGGSEGTPPAPAPVRRAEPPPQTPRLVVPDTIEGDTPETRMRFLAHWHGILCEQLPLRVNDPGRREALLSLAARLNPAGWIDADEIAAGLQQASEALEGLSRILSKRRRKARRPGQREARATPADGGDSSATAPSPNEPESLSDEWKPEAPADGADAEDDDAAPPADAGEEPEPA